MAPASIIFTSHQEYHITYHIFSVRYLILLWLEENGSILMDNLSTVTVIVTVILSTVAFSNNPANITVCRPNGQNFYEVSISGSQSISGNEFKCCLPSSCSGSTTNIIIVDIDITYIWLNIVLNIMDSTRLHI